MSGIATEPAVRGFQYKYGDRPLDGFTIQRGAGRGGFGEVYYALSDSGREVALKLIHTYEQIELRGIGQCMNLKSPHLVTIFDVKYGQDGRPWVIMEYVSGPSLRELLDQSPSGMGAQKAAFFLREIGKGLTYLHDCGIVHRDLKPGNIFYENGYVKIGDYGLSKAISTSQHSGQTVTVGTLHYMAPEIGEGRYDKSIDIYALGALLYEMLTGQVPFFGASPAEVLMKHLSTEVSLDNVEEPFKSVIRKAMAKNPADRYQSVQEMVEAVFGSEHVRNSVSCFSPDSLTIVAGHAARNIAPGSSVIPQQVGLADRWQGLLSGRLQRAHNRMGCARRRLFGAKSQPRTPAQVEGVRDPLPLAQRIVLACLCGGIVSVLAGMMGSSFEGFPMAGIISLFGAAGATAAVLLSRNLILPSLKNEQKALQRLASGGAACLGAVITTLPFWTHEQHFRGPGTYLATFAALFIMDWDVRTSAARFERVAVERLITAAILGLLLGGIFDGSLMTVIGIAVGTSLAVQVCSAWAPPAARTAGAFPVVQKQVMGQMRQEQVMAPPPVPPAPPVVSSSSSVTPPPPVPAANVRLVPGWIRIMWLVLFVLSTSAGLMLIFGSMFSNLQQQDAAVMFSVGAGVMCLSMISFRRSRWVVYPGIYQYLLRPLIRLAAATTLFIMLALLAGGRMDNSEVMVVVFFLILSSMVLIMMTFIRSHSAVAPPLPPMPPAAPSQWTLPRQGPGVIVTLAKWSTSAVGMVVLLASLLIGVAMAADIPGLFNSPLVDPQVSADMTRQFGSTRWPQVMEVIGSAIAAALGVVSAVLLMVPRRGGGGLHVMRAALAVVVLLAAAATLGRALPAWSEVITGARAFITLEDYLRHVHMRGLVQAGLLVMLGLLLLVWPARRPQPATGNAEAAQ